MSFLSLIIFLAFELNGVLLIWKNVHLKTKTSIVLHVVVFFGDEKHIQKVTYVVT